MKIIVKHFYGNNNTHEGGENRGQQVGRGRGRGRDRNFERHFGRNNNRNLGRNRNQNNANRGHNPSRNNNFSNPDRNNDFIGELIRSVSAQLPRSQSRGSNTSRGRSNTPGPRHSTPNNGRSNQTPRGGIKGGRKGFSQNLSKNPPTNTNLCTEQGCTVGGCNSYPRPATGQNSEPRQNPIRVITSGRNNPTEHRRVVRMAQPADEPAARPNARVRELENEVATLKTKLDAMTVNHRRQSTSKEVALQESEISLTRNAALVDKLQNQVEKVINDNFGLKDQNRELQAENNLHLQKISQLREKVAEKTHEVRTRDIFIARTSTQLGRVSRKNKNLFLYENLRNYMV